LCKIAICSLGISVPSGPQNIKSFEKLSGETAEMNNMAQLKCQTSYVLNTTHEHAHHIFARENNSKTYNKEEKGAFVSKKKKMVLMFRHKMYHSGEMTSVHTLF